MSISWPNTLPQNLEVQGFEETVPNTVIASQVECGAPKRRQRYTAAIRPIKGSVFLTSTAQRQTLDDFYVNTLSGGSLTFSWQHPITLAAVTMAFSSPPKYAALGGSLFRATLELEIRP